MESPARRIPVPESGDVSEVIFDLEPGDYCGPSKVSTTNGKPTVFFVLSDNSGIRHITEPPWVFTEQPDGSLEIRESILAYGVGGRPDWHGYLDAGNVWRQI